MRIIAQRCLYGVDRNPMAVDLAKLSLWLVTLAKDHPFTFVDHAIRCGDSLVGLTRRQIETFSWKSEFTTGQLWENEVRKRTADALRERQILLGIGDDYGTPQLKRERLENADELLNYVRFIGDAAICSFFSADKDKAREAKRQEFIERLSDNNFSRRPIAEVKALRTGQFPVMPFHWEIEYPEVFDRENPGFDAIVGNPPFAGKNTLINGNREGYLDWLKTLHAETHGNADLVAHFFRRAFTGLRADGCFGLIATNTIGQGDTRASGLRWICLHGGTIYAARKRYKWPGQAAVVVSVVWIAKGNPPSPFDLDGRSVQLITAYLFHFGGHENPNTLKKNEKLAFKGCEIGGLGYLLSKDDEEFSAFSKLTDPRDATKRLLKPYIGGEDLNAIASDGPSRFVLDVDGFAENQMRALPDVYQFLKLRLRPDFLNRGEVEESTIEWWHFRRPSLELRKTIGCHSVILALSRVSDTLAFTFVPGDSIANSDIICFQFDTFHALAVLQSRSHEVWVRREASSMKDDPRYTPSDCFETFPFPKDFETAGALEAAGREYYEFRAALMVRNNEGLTKTYNRFHDPEESSQDIVKLRELHAKLDAAVLAAYGWTDLSTTCDFILDYEDEESAEESSGRKKKKPWRFRWPDEVRDEVLARLLKLNAERAEQETLAGEAAAAIKPVKAKRTAKKVTVPKEQIGLSFRPVVVPRKHSRGINFKRGAVASYAVNRLSDRWEFGRTQMEKVLYGAQQVVGVDLEMDFKAFAAGPFDEEIHKLESLANKQKWFHSAKREGGKGTEYQQGSKIMDRCGAAKSILGNKLAEFDRILDWMAKMNSEQAGIWTTVHSVWNDLILAGEPVTDDRIVKSFYEFHEAKTAIEQKRVRACIQWLRDNQFVPTGILFESSDQGSEQTDLFA